jgi:hypothetical protein
LVYPGILAIDGLWRFVKSEQMPPFQRMRYQQHLACFFVDSKGVLDEDKQRINQLGLKFRGKNWITFESALLNLVPSACTLSEAEILVEIYQQLIFAINDLMSDKVQVNFELGQVLHRQFDPLQTRGTALLNRWSGALIKCPCQPSIRKSLMKSISFP